MKTIRPLIAYEIMIIFSAVFLGLSIGSTFLFAFLPDFDSNVRMIAGIISGVMVMIFTTGLTMSIKSYSDQKHFLDQLKVENSYALGKESSFYNLEAFKARVRKLKRRSIYANKEQYIVAFTPTALDINTNQIRSRLMVDLNLHLAEFLDKLFVDNSNTEFEKRYNVYCFNRGIFLFYCFTNDKDYVHHLLNRISNECFRMVNEDKIKIWVQPFFGINHVKDDSSLTSAIEDAILARAHSEKNYESFTYFKESFRDSKENSSDEIQKALNNDEFIPYYQAKFSLKEQRFISTEVLARWKSPKYGVVGPAKFIEQAERAGLLNAIDVRIFELAVRDLGENIKRGRKVLPVSVNFSLYEFFSRNFLDTILNTLRKYNVPTNLLEIEITETTSQVNKFLSLSVIKKLKEYGIRVLMDDFGVGYSQIENLRQIPFDAIKIDKSFTDRIIEDPKTRTIVKLLVDLGHSNGMEVIIEGVENKEQVDILRKMKADTIQGFYYTRPISFAGYNEMLKSNAFEKGMKK